MYKERRKMLVWGVNLFSMILYFLMTLNLTKDESFIFSFFVASVLYCIIQVFAVSLIKSKSKEMKTAAISKHESSLLSSFISKMRYAYSIDDFIAVLQKELEDKADCSVLFVDKEKDYVIYNSPARITSDKNVNESLERNFSKDWQEGVFFIDDSYYVASNVNRARGFFISSGKKHLYVFCRYTRLFDEILFPQLYSEFVAFQKRSSTVKMLSQISELTKEWKMVAETQLSFLPKKLPIIDKLDIAAYFRPLVNVSGDYYTVLPIDEHKTLLVLGDVSGKGLAAALVMGIVINTIKSLEDRENLVDMIYAVDRAIKEMHLQDKYTVLFLGVVDTEKMMIRYINASMSDPIIITKAPSGYKIKPLASNCSVVGIIELDDVHISEQKLFREDVILMASDGVSEVMNEEGVELGDTDLYINTVTNSANKTAQYFVSDIVDLVMNYNGNKRLRDDVTMLAVKIER